MLKKIEEWAIDDLFCDQLPLEEAPDAYKTCRDKEGGCIKVVWKP